MFNKKEERVEIHASIPASVLALMDEIMDHEIWIKAISERLEKARTALAQELILANAPKQPISDGKTESEGGQSHKRAISGEYSNFPSYLYSDFLSEAAKQPTYVAQLTERTRVTQAKLERKMSKAHAIYADVIPIAAEERPNTSPDKQLHYLYATPVRQSPGLVMDLPKCEELDRKYERAQRKRSS